MSRETPCDQALRAALDRAKRRAHSKGWSFSLTLDDLRAMWWDQNGRCSLSGLEFHEERFPDVQVRQPFGPSLDREQNSKGYDLDNVRLVCAAVNFARGQWGDDVLRQVAHGIVETERHEERTWYAQQKARLAVAKAELSRLTGEAHKRQKRVVAGIRASITKGPSRSRAAARRANKGQLD